MNRISTLLLLAAYLCAPLSSAANELPAVIALFGDSTTVGYVPPRDHNGNAYPDKFEERFGNGTTTRGIPTSHLSSLLNNGTPVYPSIVTNWGVGGTSTSVQSYNGVDRMNSNLATAASTHNGYAYYVLIIYGSNDFGYGLSANDTGANIEIMINIARGRGFTPIVGTTSPRSDRNLSDTNQKIKDAAANRGAPVVDHFTAFNNYPGGPYTLMTSEISVTTGQPVQLHPTSDGYRFMAQNWFDGVLKNELISRASAAHIGAISILLLDDDEEIIVIP